MSDHCHRCRLHGVSELHAIVADSFLSERERERQTFASPMTYRFWCVLEMSLCSTLFVWFVFYASVHDIGFAL